jgi:hypothetical protein
MNVMHSLRLAGPLTLLIATVPASGADDPRIEDFALCRESWLDLEKSDPAALERFGIYLNSEFTRDSDDGHLAPKAATTVNGLNVSQVFPSSLGMGLGFSVLLEAPFDVARQAVERDLGRELVGCDGGDGVRACELPIAEKRTVLVVSEDAPNDQTTLVGCYYYYEK